MQRGVTKYVFIICSFDKVVICKYCPALLCVLGLASGGRGELHVQTQDKLSCYLFLIYFSHQSI